MFRCETCRKPFPVRAASERHMTDLGHWKPHHECETCHVSFKTQEEADAHMDQLVHWLHLCGICGEHFASALFLEMHEKSNVHRPAHHECPFCFDGFATPSAVAHHLESTCCPIATWLNVASLHAIIKDVDPLNLITVAGATPEINQGPPIIRYKGPRFACYRCDRTFPRQTGLEAHLSSPFHQPRIYHCLNLPDSCDKTFVSLAAMWNHIESEACGVMFFEDLEHVHNQLKRATLGHHKLSHADFAV